MAPYVRLVQPTVDILTQVLTFGRRVDCRVTSIAESHQLQFLRPLASDKPIDYVTTYQKHVRTQTLHLCLTKCGVDRCVRGCMA